MREISFWEAAFLWRDPLIAASLGAVLCALVGVFVVLRRSAFVGAAVGQASSLGVVLALLAPHVLGASVPPLFAGLATGAISAALFGLSGRKGRLGVDAAIALAYVIAGGAALLLGTLLPHEYEEVHGLLFGDAVSAPIEEIVALAACLVVVVVAFAAFFPRIVFASFDPETAQGMGLAVGRTNALLYFLLGLSIAVSTRALGALTVFALTVIPAAGGLLACRCLPGVFAWAIGAALVAAVGGYYLSFVWELPTGATIVVALAVTLGFAAGIGRFRR
ncbi:MAG TPA: metal ABC transporter permease [Fredinandcohnia sp.]|nr:metal ABC transporter permease [Fredinandcohnia sp.]